MKITVVSMMIEVEGMILEELENIKVSKRWK